MTGFAWIQSTIVRELWVRPFIPYLEILKVECSSGLFRTRQGPSLDSVARSEVSDGLHCIIASQKPAQLWAYFNRHDLSGI